MDEGVSVDRRSPDETFALLGNEIRVAILRALAADPDDARSFSDLREAVGERDSGKFNYHLRKLTDQFVKHTDDGYELSLAGRQVVGALLAGTYTADATMAPIPIDEPCPECEADSLEVAYEDEHVLVRCTNCEEFYNEFTFPPGALDQYDTAALPEALDRWLWTTFARIIAGFCPTCGGRMDGRLVLDDTGRFPAAVRGQFDCTRCGDHASTSAVLPVYFHPAVMGFYYDHGLDVTAEPTWRLSAVQDEYEIELVSEDPPRVRVVIGIGGDVVTAVVDESGTVTSIDRSDAGQK